MGSALSRCTDRPANEPPAAAGRGAGPPAVRMPGRPAAVPASQPSATKRSVNVKQHVETATKTGALNLADAGLKKIPDRVLQLGALRTLNLSSNNLAELPVELGGMAKMKQFNASFNALVVLPHQLFADWKACEVLNLGGNRLHELPDLGGMSRLRRLLLGGNDIAALPESIAACVKLEVLDLSRNKLATLPPMGSCRLLSEVNLSSNGIIMLPPDLAECPRLTLLDISGNNITAAAIPPAVFSDTTLARLFRDGCPIQDSELADMAGFAAFKVREQAREAKKLDQRRAETGGIVFGGQEQGIAGAMATQDNAYS